MATATTLPAAEPPACKTTRSMTHPLRNPKGNNGRRRVKQGEPFDPEELCRRLTAHLAEQKSKADRRHASSSAKAKDAQQNGVYHHVPKVAAAAFERTATPDNPRRSIHRASQIVLRQPLDLLHENEIAMRRASSGIPALKETQARDQAMIDTEMLRNRNQFQWDRSMEEAVEVDVARDLYKPPQRTFEEFAYLRGTRAQKTTRAMSTGDVFPDVKVDPANYRNDWAQRDDEKGGRTSRMDWATPLLKKRDSIWTLGRKEKSPKQEKADPIAEAASPPPPDKMGRRFLARFKR